jgi:hypothetical protein
MQPWCNVSWPLDMLSALGWLEPREASGTSSAMTLARVLRVREAPVCVLRCSEGSLGLPFVKHNRDFRATSADHDSDR